MFKKSSKRFLLRPVQTDGGSSGSGVNGRTASLLVGMLLLTMFLVGTASGKQQVSTDTPAQGEFPQIYGQCDVVHARANIARFYTYTSIIPTPGHWIWTRTIPYVFWYDYGLPGWRGFWPSEEWGGGWRWSTGVTHHWPPGVPMENPPRSLKLVPGYWYAVAMVAHWVNDRGVVNAEHVQLVDLNPQDADSVFCAVPAYRVPEPEDGHFSYPDSALRPGLQGSASPGAVPLFAPSLESLSEPPPPPAGAGAVPEVELLFLALVMRD